MANFGKISEEAQGHLDPDEEPICQIGGAYECKIMGNDSVRNGVMIATSERVFFYAKKMFSAYDSETFPYENISSIESSKGALMGHKVTFFASGNKVSMKWVQWGEPEKFVEVVREKMSKKAAPAPTPTATEPDLADQIRKLAELKDQGILTEDEFSAKKRQLLGI